MRKLELASCLCFNYLAQEGLISETLGAEGDNDEPFPQRSSGLQRDLLFPPQGMSLWALSCVWEPLGAPCPESSLLGRVTIADGEVKAFSQGKQKEHCFQRLELAAWMKDILRFFPAWHWAYPESHGIASVPSPQPHLSAIPRGRSGLQPVFLPTRNVTGQCDSAPGRISLFSLCSMFRFSFAGL